MLEARTFIFNSVREGRANQVVTPTLRNNISSYPFQRTLPDSNRGILINNVKNLYYSERIDQSSVRFSILENNLEVLAFNGRILGQDLELQIDNRTVILPGGGHFPIRLLSFAISANLRLATILERSGPKTQDYMDRCIDHDMSCSIFGTPFLGADITDCCLEHDIALWCADGSKSFATINDEVIQCVTNRVAIEWGKSPLFYFFPVAWVVSLVSRLVNLIFSEMGWWGDASEYPYLGGGADWSCLCGGSEQTYCCHPDKNPDLCLYRNGKLKPLCEPKCFKCSNKCVYDNSGFPIRIDTIRDPKGELPCCFGTPSKMTLKDCPV